MPLLVVDEDGTEGSRAFINTLEAASEIDVRITDREDATESVRRGKSVAYVALKPGFGEATEHVFWGDPPTVELATDPARQAEAAMIEGILMKYRSEDMQVIMSDPQAQRDNLSQARASLEQSAELPVATRSNLEQLFNDLERFWGEEMATGESTGAVD